MKLRPNPFKASAKLAIFPWCKVWDDAVWDNLEKVASMLPDLRKSFLRNEYKGRIRATQNGRTDATSSVRSTITENSKGENTKQQQAAACKHASGTLSEDVPRKPPTDACSETASPLGQPAGVAGRAETLEGFSEMQSLLDRFHAKVQHGQIQELIEADRTQGLSIDGVFAFLEDKLRQKREQGDAVYSAKLLIKAIGDKTDLARWAAKAHRYRHYFEQTRIQSQGPFSIQELIDHLSSAAKRLREAAGYDETQHSSMRCCLASTRNIAISRPWSGV